MLRLETHWAYPPPGLGVSRLPSSFSCAFALILPYVAVYLIDDFALGLGTLPDSLHSFKLRRHRPTL